jgi:hypothetical protein
MIIGTVGELVDALLVNGEPVGDSQFLSNELLIPMCVLTDTIIPRWHAFLAMQKCPLERTLVLSVLTS